MKNTKLEILFLSTNIKEYEKKYFNKQDMLKSLQTNNKKDGAKSVWKKIVIEL